MILTQLGEINKFNTNFEHIIIYVFYTVIIAHTHTHTLTIIFKIAVVYGVCS